MRLRAVVLFLFSAPTAALPSVLDTLPPSDEITINSVSVSGSGCPKNAVSISISEDRTIVTLGFDDFQTYYGQKWGRADSDKDKTCLILLNVHYPSGYTMAVVDVTYHGFAQLDSGVTGSLTSTYTFADAKGSLTGRSSSSKTNISGGGTWVNGQEYTMDAEIPTSSVVRTSCGGKNATLGVLTEIGISSTNSSASGAFTDDDATIAFTQQVHIGWQSCA